MLKESVINELLGITESYQAPQKMLDLVLDDAEREKLFEQFLQQETNLNYEWFQGYFEAEHADRKVNKQDFTPHAVSDLLARLSGQNDSYFESAAGTGGIMLQSWVRNKENAARWYQVEELSDRAIPFLLFNMAIRGMQGLVLHGDSLAQEYKAVYRVLPAVSGFGRIEKADAKGAEGASDTVLMNPPYSAAWSADKELLQTDERFSPYGALAPKSKADFAFLLHGYHHLRPSGTMAIVLPHGVLFRGNAEGKIRTALLERGAIDAVIGLPANIFFGTSIPTTVIILKKGRTNKDVLFIDASEEFEKGKNQNMLKDEHIEKILETYKKRKSIDKYSHVASFEEIQENEYNLNIPRYVDTFEDEEPIDIAEVAKEIMSLNQQIAESESALVAMMGDLVAGDRELDAGLAATIQALGGSVRKPKKKPTIDTGQLSLFQ